MAKRLARLKVIEGNEVVSLESISRALSVLAPAHVVITCTEPNADGEMEVGLSYEGDDVLVSFLLEGALDVFNRASAQKSSKNQRF
jgi:SpoU rRNA methylase family enzyme